ncbi:oxidoreductase [Burkholderia glumae]|uniref:Oxidoreductase n=1 Tax=Burkholderia glumae TaxID=337 RepID=A0AAP9Y102_BURGL|nr:oxidoreductase [Burkholderia glumae]AJY67050.1 putative phage P2 baseplate assembly protein gpV [Burkholderia glumae LMG 2196 = ATCC 33617]PNL00130.1 oxidoreductase [Burkholderia glumae]QJP73101.1 oxidoreductase [Burkholderia glumae]QPQ92030.1 oxidoreductase [Burkholderia glumae]QQM89758.1 oxidoreductase [Burkholderia glumae]
MLPDDNAYLGQQDQTTDLTGFNALSFITWQILRQISGARLVAVKAVTSAGDVAPVGFVDVQPLVSQLDGWNNSVPHGTIYHLPFFRLQGGANAVIIDPQVGDIGVAVIEDRDISSAKANRGFANPGSKRIFDMADGLYIGGFLNGAPQQIVQFNAAGITISSPTQIRLAAPTIVIQATQTVGITAGQEITNSAPIVEVDGQMTQGEGPLGGNAAMQGPLIVQQDVTAAGTSLHSHTHPDVQPGDANTGAPN